MKSLYVHIPFCKQKCLYCDFNSYSGKENLINEYIIALKKEIQSYNLNIFETVYFGGGTPSIIPAKYIKEIMDIIDCTGEVTLELNPGTIDEEKLKIYKEAGINRLSIGLQATQDSILKEIGRIHTLEEFDIAYKMARKVEFENISVDLMFGLPNQTVSDVKESLEYLIKIKPEHISCYSLILHNDIFKNLPTENDEREMYYLIIAMLKEAGYKHYEISNFAKFGKESKHNLCYWNQQEYVGVGAGASSYIGNKRYTNELNIEKYISKVKQNRQWYEIEEIQDEEAKIREYMILRLRLLKGLNVKEAREKFSVDIYKKFEKEINKLKRKGLIEVVEDIEKVASDELQKSIAIRKEERYNEVIQRCEYIRLTQKGLDFANYVWSEFI